MDLKAQSNRDFREIQHQETKNEEPSYPITGDIRLKEQQLRKEKENQPQKENSNSLNPKIEDIRFKIPPKVRPPPVSSQNRRMAPNFSRFSNQNQRETKTPFYNRGHRTYLSDRHSRNIDVRELSSQQGNTASYGYKYPSDQQQSAGPPKKIPGGFSESKKPKASK